MLRSVSELGNNTILNKYMDKDTGSCFNYNKFLQTNKVAPHDRRELLDYARLSFQSGNCHNTIPSSLTQHDLDEKDASRQPSLEEANEEYGKS